jgi:hypothetical protein
MMEIALDHADQQEGHGKAGRLKALAEKMAIGWMALTSRYSRCEPSHLTC